jgi:hypothetical protein
MKNLAAAAVVLGMMAVPAAQAETVLDFTLTNKTGYGISELYVAPSASTQWGESLIDETLENNESVSIEFEPDAENVKNWDIMITWVDGGEREYWRGAKLSEITKITLKYDRAKDVTSATAE